MYLPDKPWRIATNYKIDQEINIMYMCKKPMEFILFSGFVFIGIGLPLLIDQYFSTFAIVSISIIAFFTICILIIFLKDSFGKRDNCVIGQDTEMTNIVTCIVKGKKIDVNDIQLFEKDCKNNNFEYEKYVDEEAILNKKKAARHFVNGLLADRKAPMQVVGGT